MSTNKSLMDPELADGPLLSVRPVAARAFEPLVERLETAVRDDGTIIVEHDLERDRLLADYRRQFSEQVIHDVSYNLQRLWHWAVALDSSPASVSRVLCDARIQDGFRRLDELRRLLINTDAWSGNRTELECWQAIQQFYCDALALGDRLLKLETGRRLRRRPPEKIRQIQPTESASAYTLAQAVMNTFEQMLPNVLHWRPLRSTLPAAFYTFTRGLLPWPTYRWQTAAGKLRRMVTSGALASLADRAGPIVQLHGRDELLADDSLFERRTAKTLHNIVLVISHRHSMLDMPILVDVLHGIDYGMWANELYFPKSAARDPCLVLVKPRDRRALSATLEKSAHIIINQRLPLVIAVDGGGPYLMYGQQMRAKRGIRLLIDYLNNKSRSTKRRTYVVPVSFDDTAGFVMGLDRTIKVTFHQPICAQDIADPPQPPSPKLINFGDPLLNYLESLFLANTGQVRHGWRTPSVIDTVRRTRETRSFDHTIRGWIRSRFQPSLYDLSRATDRQV